MRKLPSVLTVALALAGVVTQGSPARGGILQTGRQEVFSIIVDPANLEPVMIEGENQFILRETELQNGTIWRVFRASAHGTAIGLWSGTPYEYNDTWTYSWFDPPGLAYQVDLRDIVRLVSLGASPNVLITQTMSVIRDDNGAYTFKSTYDYDITGRDR